MNKKRKEFWSYSSKNMSLCKWHIKLYFKQNKIFKIIITVIHSVSCLCLLSFGLSSILCLLTAFPELPSVDGSKRFLEDFPFSSDDSLSEESCLLRLKFFLCSPWLCDLFLSYLAFLLSYLSSSSWSCFLFLLLDSLTSSSLYCFFLCFLSFLDFFSFLPFFLLVLSLSLWISSFSFALLPWTGISTCSKKNNDNYMTGFDRQQMTIKLWRKNGSNHTNYIFKNKTYKKQITLWLNWKMTNNIVVNNHSLINTNNWSDTTHFDSKWP